MTKIAIGVAFIIALVTFPLYAWFAAAVLIAAYLFVAGMCRAAARVPEALIEHTISREEWQRHKATSPYFRADEEYTMSDEELKRLWREGKLVVRQHTGGHVEQFTTADFDDVGGGDPIAKAPPYDQESNAWTPED
jgi:hypothetical protein